MVYFAESAEQFTAMLVKDWDAKRPHSTTREISDAQLVRIWRRFRLVYGWCSPRACRLV